MVGLYNLGSLGSALYDIRVNGSLTQKFDSLQLSCFFLKNTDKLGADDLSLLFRIGYALQLCEITLCRIYIDQVCIHLIFKYLDHTL